MKLGLLIFLTFQYIVAYFAFGYFTGKWTAGGDLAYGSITAIFQVYCLLNFGNKDEKSSTADNRP